MIYGAVEKTFVLLCDNLNKKQQKEVKDIVGHSLSSEKQIEIMDSDVKLLHDKNYIPDKLYDEIMEEEEIVSYVLVF